MSLKPRANEPNRCLMLHVGSVCTPCCMLRVVRRCCAKFETGQAFSSMQTVQHCWELLRLFERSLRFLSPPSLNFSNPQSLQYSITSEHPIEDVFFQQNGVF